ncbi:unnamed protein product [Clavelina lepadiformis]|uniref:Uncharacterized protein n=1 Tax=Clavelina lepadiformis TaxID=159417 RepID=A0ABP0FEG3_CLALP
MGIRPIPEIGPDENRREGKGRKRKEAAEQEKLLAKIPKLSSYFGMRAASSQLPASDAIANSSAPEDQAKQDEPDEEREDKERESSAERAEVKGDAITGANAGGYHQ